MCLAALRKCLGDILDWLTEAKDGLSTEVAEDDADKSSRKRVDPFEMLYSVTLGAVTKSIAEQISARTEYTAVTEPNHNDDKQITQSWTCTSIFMPITKPIGAWLSKQSEVGEHHHEFTHNKWTSQMTLQNKFLQCDCSPWQFICGPLTRWMSARTDAKNRMQRATSASTLVQNPVQAETELPVWKVPDEI